MTMGMKKIPVILVVCMLLFSSLDVLALDTTSGVAAFAECCFQYYSRRLPKNKVVTFQHTHKQCATDAVLFTMKNGRKFCVDPTQDWVQNVITAVESR